MVRLLVHSLVMFVCLFEWHIFYFNVSTLILLSSKKSQLKLTLNLKINNWKLWWTKIKYVPFYKKQKNNQTSKHSLALLQDNNLGTLTFNVLISLVRMKLFQCVYFYFLTFWIIIQYFNSKKQIHVRAPQLKLTFRYILNLPDNTDVIDAFRSCFPSSFVEL